MTDIATYSRTDGAVTTVITMVSPEGVHAPDGFEKVDASFQEKLLAEMADKNTSAQSDASAGRVKRLATALSEGAWDKAAAIILKAE